MWCFAFLVVFLYGAAGQQTVSVPLKIGELQYDVTLVPTLEGVQSMASRFCKERHADFAVPMDGNIKSTCVTPVAQYLSEAVIAQRAEAQASEAPAIRVPLKLGDKEFTITFVATEMGAGNMARKFCAEQGPSLGFTEATVLDGCVRGLSEYLRDAVRKEVGVPGGTVARVSMRVGGQTFDFSWDPTVRSTRDMAVQFCSEHGAQLNVKKDEMESSCVIPVAQYLQQAGEGQGVAAPPPPPLPPTNTTPIKATIQIDANTFDFTFLPNSESARATALKFCDAYAVKLGILPENYETGCINVIMTTLLKYI